MKFEAVTIKDIAKELGVSTSTVSRALRNSYEISVETKELVLACAARLQYKPNPIALSLKEKRSRSIGVIVSEIANSFFSQAIDGIESVAYSKGYNIIISQSRDSLEREIIDLNYLASRSIDGLLISISSETEGIDHIKQLHLRGLPIVFFDRITDEIATHSVTIDNFKGGYNAAVHLIEAGFKNIACIASAEHLLITKERVAGVSQALQDHHLPFVARNVKHCPHGGSSVEEVDVAITELLQEQNKPDAIIGLGDKLTTSCLRVFQAKKIKVPEHIGLIGFSNSEVSELLNPSLSIIRQPAFNMGETATDLLIGLIESKRPTKEFDKKVFETELIVRSSTTRN
jgi:DNA-binding LacI/PurR family transcriptional regulator